MKELSPAQIALVFFILAFLIASFILNVLYSLQEKEEAEWNLYVRRACEDACTELGINLSNYGTSIDAQENKAPLCICRNGTSYRRAYVTEEVPSQ